MCVCVCVTYVHRERAGELFRVLRAVTVLLSHSQYFMFQSYVVHGMGIGTSFEVTDEFRKRV